jgi:N-acetylglucosamine-6-phosphate deacetylase
MLVSDAMPAAGLADGSYEFVDREVTVENGVAMLRGTSTLAGSTTFVGGAFRRTVLEVGLPITDVAKMCAATPARLFGLPRRGSLGVGQRADLVVLDEDLLPRRVLLAGEFV